MKNGSRWLASLLMVPLIALPEAALAKGGGGGGGAALPQIGGFWHGSYTYLVSAVPTPVTREVVITLAEDASGNVGGQYCLGVASPGCFAVRGRVQTDATVQLQLAGPSIPFDLNGSVGAITCVDGSAGLTLSGTFRVRESSGIFSFNNCPVLQ
jgi:hypothetical protein